MLSTGPRSHAGVEETRAKILGAARELFERNGTRGTTTREVADRAGVNEATLFRHFGSKRALLDAMREQACGFDEFRSFLRALPGADLREDLRQLGRHTVDHMLAKRAMMCVSLAEEAVGTDDAPEWRGPQHVREELAAYFAGHIEAGTMHGDPMFLSRYFFGIFFSLVVGRKLWGETHPEPATIDAIVDVFLNGVIA